MKIILPILSSLLLIGCNDQTTVQSSSTKSPEVVPPSTIVATPPEIVNIPLDPSSLFSKKCASCHGDKAEKQALGKSQVIANLEEIQIKDALKGYQAGTYGKEMKAIMQGQAKSLEPEQIDALAQYIPTL
ncbi:MAG: c-type cytochrome [Campylobacterales bacterium]|jgi:cytochrome c553|nr:c-type cytochrome [Campylobacterales bacterium]